MNGGLSFERRQARVEHELDSADELIRVWPNGEEGLHSQLLEKLVSLGVSPAHQDDHFVRELERARLELDTL